MRYNAVIMNVCERCPVNKLGECHTLAKLRKGVESTRQVYCEETGWKVALGENYHARAFQLSLWERLLVMVGKKDGISDEI